MTHGEELVVVLVLLFGPPACWTAWKLSDVVEAARDYWLARAWRERNGEPRRDVVTLPEDGSGVFVDGGLSGPLEAWVREQAADVAREYKAGLDAAAEEREARVAAGVGEAVRARLEVAVRRAVIAYCAEVGAQLAPEILDEVVRGEWTKEGPLRAAAGWQGDAIESWPGTRRCRLCGCTNADCSRCFERTGEPCHWVEDDLCSACVVVVPGPESPEANVTAEVAAPTAVNCPACGYPKHADGGPYKGAYDPRRVCAHCGNPPQDVTLSPVRGWRACEGSGQTSPIAVGVLEGTHLLRCPACLALLKPGAAVGIEDDRGARTEWVVPDHHRELEPQPAPPGSAAP